MERILAPVNLQQAWLRVRANKGALSVDGISLEKFPDYVRQHWGEIRQSLVDGTYQRSYVGCSARNQGAKDKKLEKWGHRFAHYMDNVVINSHIPLTSGETEPTALESA
jgi:hypothetical protein